MRDAVATDRAPRAIGPYSQAVRAGQFLFISGQIPIDPANGAVVAGDIRVQTERVLRSVGAILEAARLGYDAVVRTTVFLADLDDFAAMNEVYATFFAQPAPARSTVEVARLPKDVRIEVDVIAYSGG
jgi:2-iminobutanoate/2-iminopropanoate deaminase